MLTAVRHGCMVVGVALALSSAACAGLLGPDWWEKPGNLEKLQFERDAIGRAALEWRRDHPKDKHCPDPGVLRLEGKLSPDVEMRAPSGEQYRVWCPGEGAVDVGFMSYVGYDTVRYWWQPEVADGGVPFRRQALRR